MEHPLRRGGFARVEIAAALVVVLVLAAALLVAASESRRQSSLGDNMANLRQFAAGFAAYAADNEDRVATFSWRAGVDYGFGGLAHNDNQAASNQAVEIIRRRTGRTDLLPITLWYPWSTYHHLVLLDYLGTELPQRFTAGPEDRLRLLWQRDPLAFFFLEPGVDRPLGDSAAEKRWPYSSSYELPPAFSAADARSSDFFLKTVEQSHRYDLYMVGDRPLGGRRLTEVAFPAQKVMLFEQYQRHFGPREAFFAYPEARIPMLMSDGGAAVRKTGDSNRGFSPNSPLTPSPPHYIYRPESWQPRTLSGNTEDLITATFRWTRSGLRGRDYGGPPVPWVD